jgi:hypothetical protein
MTINFSLICQFFSGSGQILQPGQFCASPGFAKIAPWWLARRDNFSAKVSGHISADGATNTYCPYQRAVRQNVLAVIMGPQNKLSLRYESLQ